MTIRNVKAAIAFNFMCLKSKEKLLMDYLLKEEYDEIKDNVDMIADWLFNFIFDFAYSIFHNLLNKFVTPMKTKGYYQHNK